MTQIMKYKSKQIFNVNNDTNVMTQIIRVNRYLK